MAISGWCWPRWRKQVRPRRPNISTWRASTLDSDHRSNAPQLIAKGRWHPAGSSQSEAATLVLRDRMLTVGLDQRPGDPVAFNDLGTVTISDRIGRVPRRITFANGSLFETDDNDAIDRLLRGRRANRTGWIHEMERFHPRLIVVVLAVVLLAGAIYRYAIPAMVEVAVLVTPPAATRALAAGTLQSLDQAVFEESELPEARQKEIDTAFRALASHAERGPDGYSLNFRKGGPIGPNAFALPDGTIVLTDELVELADKDTDAILGVLAHEIGHVDKEHSLRQLYRAAGTAGLIMLVAGDIGSAGEEILTNGAALLTLSYSRSAESEADQVSVTLMRKAGRDPAAIGRFFALIEEKFKLEDDETSFLSTHPGLGERREQIDRLIEESK
ncbi:M48 family metallopeptidase [Ciceribacter sp. L1K23]|nr:M48 family metallopeptidase [Ciceribacter sp. L1K23]